MNDKVGYGAAGCGVLLAGMCFVSFCFWAFNVWIEPGGNISADEAFPGVLGSCCCGFLSVLIAVAGVFIAVRAKKQAKAAATPAPGFQPPG